MSIMGSGNSASVNDCFSCRVIGSLTCGGLSGYLLLSNYAEPKGSPIQRSITLAVAGSLAALAIARGAL